MSATRSSSSEVRNAVGLRVRHPSRLFLGASAAVAIVWSFAIIHAISTAQTSDQTLAELVGLSDPTGAFDNASGRLQTVSLDGAIDTNNAFFQDLGTNGRACVACHAPRDGWSTSVASLQRRFFATCKGDAKQLDPNHDNGQDQFHGDHGRGRDGEHLKPPSCGDDPIFRPVDGANSPTADVSTDEARLRAYSLLLSRGVIRIELPVPADAEFEIMAVDDPYNYATTTLLDFYRRPLQATNLRFSEAFEDNIANGVPIMWDGRETGTACVAATPPGGFSCGSGLPVCPVGQSCVAGLCRIVPQCGNPPTPRSPFTDLKAQAQHAFARHSEGMAPLSDDQLDAIVSFERALFTAQAFDNLAGSLSDEANGGPTNLSLVPFAFAENRPLAAGRGPVPQDPIVFTTYDGWSFDSTSSDKEARRASIARGQALFNTRTGVSPILGPVLSPNPVRCSTCHNAFNAGGESASPWGNGVQNGIGNFTSSAAMSVGLPMYTVRNKVTQETIQTSDLGRGMVTGKWNDINKFKVPVLRGLAGHAPYFHNGSAATLGDVIDAYQAAGFQFNFTPEERADLIAFLEAL